MRRDLETIVKQLVGDIETPTSTGNDQYERMKRVRELGVLAQNLVDDLKTYSMRYEDSDIPEQKEFSRLCSSHIHKVEEIIER